MKYVKPFDKLYEGSTPEEILARKTKRAAGQAVTLEAILKSFFALFMDVNAIKQIWAARKEETGLMKLSIDIYNHLIDVGDIMDLTKDQQLKYAKNLGIEVTEDTNVLSEIAKQLYINNYKRDFEEDLDKVVKYLEDGTNFEAFEEAHKMFLDEIKKIKEVI
jgi:hypothetical protein